MNLLATIKNFFLGIANVITSLVDFVIGFVEDLVYVIKLCGRFLAKIPALFAWLPTECLVLIVALFGVVVTYKILGREG